jgi:hypothetical protein
VISIASSVANATNGSGSGSNANNSASNSVYDDDTTAGGVCSSILNTVGSDMILGSDPEDSDDDVDIENGNGNGDDDDDEDGSFHERFSPHNQQKKLRLDPCLDLDPCCFSSFDWLTGGGGRANGTGTGSADASPPRKTSMGPTHSQVGEIYVYCYKFIYVISHFFVP